MLFVVFLFVYDDIAVDEDVVEKEELSRFRSFPAHFRQHSFPYQHAVGNRQRLKENKGGKVPLLNRC